MIRVALRGLAGRKFRAALTALAVVLGVAMVSGTFVLTDTIDKAFDAIFSESYANTDAAITGKAPDISFEGTTAASPSVPEGLLDRVRELDGVEAATGSVMDETATKILKPDGKAINTQGAPSFGFGIDPAQSQFNPLKLVEGAWPRRAEEVVIDATTADEQGYGVGDTVKIATLMPVQDFRVSGVAQYGSVSSLGTATFAVFTIPTAQTLLERKGQFDSIAVAAKDGVSPEQLVEDIKPILPATAQVKTGTEQANEQAKEVSEFTSFIRYFLLAFGAVALFVGAFVIFNTMSITVAQRTRELATLRTIGASRKQIRRAVLLEAFVIGLVASIVGFFLGVGLAYGLDWLFGVLDLDLPTADMVLAPRTVILAFVIGIVVTVLAAFVPSIRATRVSPILAVREGAELPRGRFARYTPYVALVILAVALLLLGRGAFTENLGIGSRLLSIAFGVLLLFVGVAMISSKLVRPLAAVVGAPGERLAGVSGFLARRNTLRNPGRTAATAAALMIGLALVTFVAVLSNGMKASNRGAIEEQIAADYVVTSQDGFTPFVSGAGDAAEKAPGTEVATSVRAEVGKVAGTDKYVTGIEPGRISQVYNFDWADGSDAALTQLGSFGAIVDKDFAEDHHLQIGDRFDLLSGAGRQATLEVKATYDPPPFYQLLGSVSIPKATFDRLYDRPRNQFTFINVPGEPSDAAQQPLEAALATFPDAKVQTREAWITEQDEDFNQFLTMLYVLLALSVIISIFGMINTLALAVFERTRELGMLRAVGMTRWQARTMIGSESVITALIGAAIGLPLGMFLAALVTRALEQYEVRYDVPLASLIVFAIVAVVVGVVAAILPARRAARLNVLQALQYE
ncbi:MAG TPA: FtsX-like permease family protein [Gaiellaceae bacterium]|nr:FtsX-like permease family protein [Gaiellaceae bacterium]HET8651577.1 FtsX-like permease family protein [Gaiellaceae bacterium]